MQMNVFMEMAGKAAGADKSAPTEGWMTLLKFIDARMML
jgi:hypothetical protein